MKEHLSPRKALSAVSRFLTPHWMHTRRKRRKLRRQIEDLTERYREALKKPGADETVELELYRYERGFLDSELGWLETQPLYRKARKLGIVVPKDWWVHDHHTEESYLSEYACAQLTRKIRDERLASVKKWLEVIHPVVSWIIALAALIVAALRK